MGKVYFVSGIDTDVGKTIATGMMARYLQKKSVRVITIKLIQTGNPPGFSEDREKHRKMMGGIVFPEDEMVTLPEPVSDPSVSVDRRHVSRNRRNRRG